ncbi:phosphotransferase [Microbacterium invictum]|uniref:Phosphotransferase n=1 Tax=Microbacterium invictum TaxID=515415 RepID=A0ABZ0VE68_9MICO|nr:phosphotransferase [Microbacterium invictum]WQB71906.1 phosphotransferase [Microbacterium invictum]
MPPADVEITRAVVAALVRRHVSDAASETLSPRPDTTGWDCETWRLGEGLAVRLPRRAAAAAGVAHEQAVMPALSQALVAVGVGAPEVVFAGPPDETFPYPWSVVRWHEGSAGLEVARRDRGAWAPPLARALRAIHATDPGSVPANPVRGGALATRAESIAERLAALRTGATVSVGDTDLLARLWDEGLAVGGWGGAPALIHGDLHPGNLIARGPRLVAVIDFIDVAPGDPAYDLAAAWLCFDPDGRRAFIRHLDGAFAPADWVRARAWAAAFTTILLGQSDDMPAYATLARESVAELRHPA